VEPKFKYLLIPENVYIIDFGDFTGQATGQQIIDRLRREFSTERLFEEQDDSLYPSEDGYVS
jgi:hypothetical protein